jgi:hypothetical protein
MWRSADAPLLSFHHLRRFLNHFFLLQLFQLLRDDDLAIRRVGIVVEVFIADDNDWKKAVKEIKTHGGLETVRRFCLHSSSCGTIR